MKNPNKAIFRSLIAVLLCVSMLIGTTFAWFTDEVTSSNNLIQQGNLDIELEWYSELLGRWLPVNENTNVFEEGTLWEPGHTEVVYLRITNKGSLALKYQLGVNVISQTEGTNVLGDKFKLSDHIYMGVVEDVLPTFASRDAARNAVTASGTLSSGYFTSGEMTARGEEHYLAMVVYMPESVGNVANYKTGTTAPVIHLGILLQATQKTHESDSFGPDYDQNVQFPAMKPGSITVDVTGKVGADNKLTEDVPMANEEGTIFAIARAGTLLEPGTRALQFSVGP